MDNNFKRQFLEMLQPDKAAIFADSVGVSAQYRVLTQALDTAVLPTRPYRIGFPFKALQVYTSTDANVVIYFKPSTQDDSQDWIPLRLNNSIKFAYPIQEGFLYWTAQASKSVSIIFLLNGEFSTNQFVQSISGGFTLQDGSSVSPQSAVTASTTATSILASNTTRKFALIQNNDSIPVYISGASSVTDDAGANPGIKLQPGESFEWRSSSAVYLIASSAGATGKIGINVFS